MEIKLPISPVPKERPRRNRNGKFYTPEKTRTFEQEIRDLARHLKPLNGALHATMLFYIPVKDKKLWGENHYKRPDIDNLVKSTSDALNGLAWHDDGQIASLTVKKIYSEKGLIHIFVERI